MAKLVLLLLAGFVIFSILKRYRNNIDSAPPKEINEDMIRCDHCQIYLPRSESITSHDKFFCSDAHRREHIG